MLQRPICSGLLDGSRRTHRRPIDRIQLRSPLLCLTLANQAHHGHRRLPGGAGRKCGAAYSEGEGAPDRRHNRRCSHPTQSRCSAGDAP